jgi:hypothetical protein
MSPIHLIDLAHLRDQGASTRHAHVATVNPFAFLLRWFRFTR